MPAGRAVPARRAAAVVINPTKFDDLPAFAKTVRAAMSDLGWDEPLWLETTVDETGEGLARTAVQAGTDLVLAVGGDGTVTACAAGVAGSGIPLGVLPVGTGNLLARNLGLPLELDAALAVALTGADRQLDVGTVNGRQFVVMAGIGFDAKMLGGASEPMKKRLGWLAYVLAALRHLGDRPMRVRLQADGGTPVRCLASLVVIGNVGTLQGGVSLLPGAKPDDGMLDAVVLTARGWAGWLALTAHVLLRRPAPGRVRRITFRELRVDLDRPQPWEIDGEVMGSARQLEITVQPARLLLRGPNGRAGP
jgi:YegS/Rv2252/BmrU family lipid kinase